MSWKRRSPPPLHRPIAGTPRDLLRSLDRAVARPPRTISWSSTWPSTTEPRDRRCGPQDRGPGQEGVSIDNIDEELVARQMMTEDCRTRISSSEQAGSTA